MDTPADDVASLSPGGLESPSVSGYPPGSPAEGLAVLWVRTKAVWFYLGPLYAYMQMLGLLSKSKGPTTRVDLAGNAGCYSSPLESVG